MDVGKDYKKGILELESMLVVKMMQSEYAHNIMLRSIVEDMTFINTRADWSFSHCFHECNATADCLAKLATTLDEPTLYQRLDDMPGNTTSSFILDELQLPILLVRYDKVNFFVSWTMIVAYLENASRLYMLWSFSFCLDWFAISDVYLR